MAEIIDRTSDVTYENEWGLCLPPSEISWDEARTGGDAAPVRGKRWADWIETGFNAIWMALMLSCTVACVSRLLWAVQA